MTKEKLEQYADLLKEIEDLQKKIDRLENQSEMVSDIVQNGYKRHAKIFGVDLIRQHRLSVYREKIQSFYDRLLKEQQEIDDYIESIKEPGMRRIFKLRYEEKLPWYKIAQIMNLNDESTPRKRVDRFLEKNF